MSDIFTLFFYSDFRLCLRKAGSPRTDSESIEFHITGLKTLFHNRRRHCHHHHHHHSHYLHQFPGLLSVVSSVCLRNFSFILQLVPDFHFFLRRESQFEASFRIRVSSTHSTSNTFTSEVRNFEGHIIQVQPISTTFTALFIHN